VVYQGILTENDSVKMKPPEKMKRLFQVRPLTNARMALALAVALAADGLQLCTVGVPPFDYIIDVAAMILVSRLIGFHFLLLPSFLIELVPFEVLPTWTACTGAVIALRKREQRTGKTRVPPAIKGSEDEPNP
jgi:hypothetical protein